MIEKFFADISIASAQQKARHALHAKKGDFFNVFNVLGLSISETTHSAFIAELLNPHGSHGLGDFFLKKFLTYAHIENLQLDVRRACVQMERYIGEIDEDYNCGGRIDIIIEANNKAVIIENKIYAQDQYKQLIRYNDYAQKTYADYRLLYLTLGNGAASDVSTKCTHYQLLPHKDYYPITYSTHILEWLENCVEEMPQETVVNVIVTQYIDLLKQLTHQKMEANNIILDALKKEENWAVCLEVIANADSWRQEVWNSFYNQLEERVHKLGWLIENRSVFDFDTKKHKDAKWVIGLTYENSGAYIGIRGCGAMAPQQCLPCLHRPTQWWPFGYKYLEGNYRNIKPYYDIASLSYLFPENRKALIDYLIREITTIFEEAEKADIYL